MTPQEMFSINTRQMRLETLVRLRWLAITGQTTAVLIVYLVLNFSYAVSLALALIGLSAWVNILLRMRFDANHHLTDKWAALLLGYDVLQLFGLLFLTGGLQNPFAILLIGPTIVGATTLGTKPILALGAITALLATTLAFFHFPLPWFAGSPLQFPDVYVFGQWIALTLCLAFTTFYAYRVSTESQQLADALAASELVLQREQHLSALDGLAAAAAHELGTPLATIAVVSKELERALAESDPLAQDAELIRSQAERCGDILAKLRSLSNDPQSHFGPRLLSDVAREALYPHETNGAIAIETRTVGLGPEPLLPRYPGIVYGLGNFIENAVEFASSQVIVTLDWNETDIVMLIVDDGPGFSPDDLLHAGEPYRSEARSPRQRQRRIKRQGGLGLGVFIAKTLLNRSGAQIALSNRARTNGAQIKVTWPREVINRQLAEQAQEHWPTNAQPQPSALPV